jgi:tripartite-type tricarboxylate transporter receptor subunit TctC
MQRRGLLAAPLVLALPARAQGRFPDRPVTIIVPFVAGGSTDVVMRALASAATERLGQPVLVENRPGAGSSLGPAAVARARPDGYLLTQLPNSAIRLTFLQRLSYDVLRDFTPVVHLTGYLFGVIVRKDARWRNWAEFVAEAKANPGKLTIGNAGTNGTPHLGALELAQRAGIELLHVPYRGEAESAQAVLGGHVDAAATTALGGAMVTDGLARWLNTWTAERTRKWPEAPTLLELGYEGMVVSGPYGLVGPAGMDPAVTKTLHDALHDAMADPAHVAVLERFDMNVDYKNSADYAAFLRQVVPQEQALVRRLGLVPN